MGLFSKTKRPEPLDRRRSLAGIPVLNEGIELERQADGRVMVTVCRERGTGWLARFQPPTIRRSFRLDELGTYVVGLVDGERSVKDVIDRFVVDHKVNRREAELCTVEFMKSLVLRGIVSIVIP